MMQKLKSGMKKKEWQEMFILANQIYQIIVPTEDSMGTQDLRDFDCKERLHCGNAILGYKGNYKDPIVTGVPIHTSKHKDIDQD